MSGLLPQHGEILLYDNGADKQFVSVVFKDETFWLTQSGMAELFDCSADNISLHLKNIYADGELEQAATTEKFSVVRKEGSREVRRSIDHYDLDAIIAVGYRVNSKKASNSCAYGIYRSSSCRRLALRNGGPQYCKKTDVTFVLSLLYASDYRSNNGV